MDVVELDITFCSDTRCPSSVSKVMDAFMGVFPIFDFTIEKCMSENNNAFCPELIHRKMVDCFGIDIQAHPIMITLPRF